MMIGVLLFQDSDDDEENTDNDEEHTDLQPVVIQPAELSNSDDSMDLPDIDIDQIPIPRWISTYSQTDQSSYQHVEQADASTQTEMQ